MTKAIAHTYDIAKDYKYQLTCFLIATIAVLGIAYAFNVYLLVTRTVSMQQIQVERLALEKEINKLDAEYLALSKQITPDSLAQYGMKEGKVTAFISRTASLGHVSLVNEL